MGEVICIAPLTSGAGSKTFKMNNVLNTKEQQHCSQMSQIVCGDLSGRRDSR